MSEFSEMAGAFGVSAVVSAAACAVVIAARVIDAPGGLLRKGDRAPTPSAGGLGIGLGTCAGVIFLASPWASDWLAFASPSAPEKLSLALAIAFGALIIGLMDDIATFGPRFKGALFVGLAIATPVLIGAVKTLPIGLGVALPLGLVVGTAGSALWMFTIMNTVNFMDGANGLAMGSAAVGSLGLAVASFAVGAPVAGGLALCTAGALIGFLLWNYPHGRLFAGDTGALFVGAMVGVVGLLAITEGGLSPFIPPLIFFPMLADVLLTLAWRVKYRSKILEGHRDHFYHIAIRSGVAHWKVSLIYWALMAKCAIIGVALAMIPSTPPLADVAAALADTSPLTRVFVLMAAGLASLATVIAFVVLAGVWLKASAGIRAYAKARGHDSE